MMSTFCRAVCTALAVIVAGVPVCAEAALARYDRNWTFDFDRDGGAQGWKLTGDVAIDRSRNHGSGSGGSLRLGPGGRAVLNVAKADSVGRIEFWVYEDGASPADPRAHRDGPVWGVRNAEGLVQAIGDLYAPYLDGAHSYAIGVSPDGANLYRDVVYLGIPRTVGWHRWTFTFDDAKGWKVTHDGKDIDADRPVIIQENVKARGFVSVVLAGDSGPGPGQTLWVDDVSVRVTGPLRNTGVPESRVMDATEMPVGGYYAAWKHGPPKDPNWFPIAVWLQNPSRAAEFRALGINLYIGLWEGPTEEQLAALKKAGMPVICEQNAVSLKRLDDPTIIGWMQMDEPDNAQPDGKGGYGPPVPPEEIVRRYRAMKAADPTRPVYLGLGQAVAWDNYYGRGVRTRHPEDYPEYAKGGDILSYDVYPVVSTDAEVRGKLWKVPFGLERLIEWSGGHKPVWNALECTRISNPNAKPTPAQVRAEVWMSLIHGSHGIVYFVHQFQEAGGFIEAALLADKEMSEAVRQINRQVLALAPELNSPTVGDVLTLSSENVRAPVDAMVKRHGGATTICAVAMRDAPTTAHFTLKGLRGKTRVTVLGEGRELTATDGRFADRFQGYEVHLYRIVGH